MLVEMLTGTYYHNMDVKGRMSFPNKLREQIGEKFMVTRGNNGCLFVYPEEEWEVFAEKIKAVPMGKGGNELRRFFIAGACEVEADKQGRILIPQALRDHAKLEKDIVVLGTSDRAEIWDRESYEAYMAEFSENKLDAAMAELDI